MLNGIAPIIIITFYKDVPLVGPVEPESSLTPAKKKDTPKVPLIPIPIYLDEKLTGIYIDSESKNIDISTDVDTKTDSAEPEETQKGLNSSVTINLFASREAIGTTILIALLDTIFPMASSDDYSVTYLNKAVTVFGGKVISFSVNLNSDNDLYDISITLSRAGSKLPTPLPKTETLQPTVPANGGATL